MSWSSEDLLVSSLTTHNKSIDTMMRQATLPILWSLCLYVVCQLALNVNSLSLKTQTSSRRQWLQQSVATVLVGGGVLGGVAVPPTEAAPPIAVIAEELGYFPVRNSAGEVVYIPKKIRQKSTDQAVELAKRMQEKGVSMYGTYWCPHCSRQKELFGQEAWDYINYVECASKGYGFKGICKNVDGYPTFKDKKGKINFSGERSLADLATQVGFTSFDPSLEPEVPMVGTACKLR
jgi:glutaredoxin-related protein